MKEFLLARISEAETVDDLNYIVHFAQTRLKNKSEIREITETALKKFQTW